MKKKFGFFHKICSLTKFEATFKDNPFTVHAAPVASNYASEPHECQDAEGVIYRAVASKYASRQLPPDCQI